MPLRSKIKVVSPVAGEMAVQGEQVAAAGAAATAKCAVAPKTVTLAHAASPARLGQTAMAANSPELSLVRLGNRGASRKVEVRAFVLDRNAAAPINRRFTSVNLPTQHDLMVAVPDWATLDAHVETLSFE